MFPNDTKKPSGFRIQLIRRRPTVVPSKVIPIKNNESHIEYENTQSSNTFQRDSFVQPSSHNEAITETTELSTINSDVTEKPSTLNSTEVLSPIEKPSVVSNVKQTTSASSGWFSRLTPKQKLFTKIALVAVLLVICATAATLPPVLILTRRELYSSSIANITMSACSSQTCIGKETPFRALEITVLYAFDGNVNDLSGYAIGTVFGSNLPPNYPNQGYVRQTINLNANFNQYINIPYVNLAQQSFTLQIWIFPLSTSVQVNYGIFGLCDTNLTCLSLSLLNYHVTLSFDSMNINSKILMGATVLEANTWYHITVVYDAVLLQQLIYVNGNIDAVSNGIVYPYKGKSLGVTANIGQSSSFTYNSSYFHGWIDQFTILTGVVRSSCEAYNDATLTAYYPFDTNGTFLDYSIKFFHGIGINIQPITSGRLRQAIAFGTSPSYFQAQCFPSLRINNPPFSVALWIKPTIVIGGGTIIHVSSDQTGNGTFCYDLLGLTNSGILIAQLMQTSTLVSGVQGPLLSINNWIHVALVYAPRNGMRLYINGELYATSVMTSATLSAPSPTIALFITLGNNSPLSSIWTAGCPSSGMSLVSGSYRGAIDEFRLYSRELNSQEMCVLANV